MRRSTRRRILNKNKNAGPAGKEKKKAGGDSTSNHVPDPFYCKLETIRIKKNGSNIVPVTFLPFELGVHK